MCIRDRSIIYDEFTSKEHEILTGVVSRIEPRTGGVSIKISSNSCLLYTSSRTSPRTTWSWAAWTMTTTAMTTTVSRAFPETNLEWRRNKP